MFGFKKDIDFKYNLGDIVEDKITSFKGVVVTRSQWLNACNTYRVQPTILKDGIPQDPQNFDEPQLKLVEADVHEKDRRTGGPDRPVANPHRF